MKHVHRFIQTTAGACLALLGLPGVVLACEKCFGAAAVDDPTTRGIGLAMLSLLAMTGLVWAGIGLFFLNMRKRIRQLEPGRFVVTEQGQILPSTDETPG